MRAPVLVPGLPWFALRFWRALGSHAGSANNECTELLSVRFDEM
jgi:hypothetical protein